MNRQEAIKQAKEAKQLTNALQPYIDEMRGECHKNIERSTFWQKNEREAAYKMLRAIDLFERKLKKRVQSGIIAAQKEEK